MNRFLLALVLMSLALPAVAQEQTGRITDSTLTQTFTSEFGYTFLLPAKAKPNPIGSSINKAGRTQTANYILSGGCGAIKIWNYHETQVVPARYALLDSVVYYDTDSAGVNGKIYQRSYILDSIVVRIEVLLTAKGTAEYAEKVRAIFDSFVPPAYARKELPQWRFEYGKMHNGTSGYEWERKNK